MEVKATTDLNGEKIVAVADLAFGDNLNDAIELYGEDLVYNLYIQKIVIKAQDFMRNWIKAGKSPEEVNQMMSDWTPEATGPSLAKDPTAAYLARLSRMTPDEQRAALEELRQKISDMQ